jgi:hypothetical protein
VARNLSLFPFNNRANIATSGVGWYVEAGVVVDALAGDDKITGTVTSLDGIGDGINNVGAINTGEGDDIIIGTSIGDDGIDNVGTINTGKGNDIITGTVIRDDGIGDGINNVGAINTGEGDDIIIGTSIGDDGIDNVGTINTGKGNDIIIGTAIRADGIDDGIDNIGTINTGEGDDTIMGTSIGDDGIDNVGTINTGEGNDLVNALKGGFGGNGSTFLGGNNDTLKGFGTGSFYGGTGIDKILFGQGTYTVSGTTIVSDGVTMNVNEFETIGGANGGLFAFKDGTLIVDSGGVGTFA